MKKVEESNYDSLGVIPNDDIMASGWRLSNEGKKRGVELLQENEELREKLKSIKLVKILLLKMEIILILINH